MKILSERLKTLQVVPPEEGWSRISKSLESERRRRGGIKRGVVIILAFILCVWPKFLGREANLSLKIQKVIYANPGMEDLIQFDAKEGIRDKPFRTKDSNSIHSSEQVFVENYEITAHEYKIMVDASSAMILEGCIDTENEAVTPIMMKSKLRSDAVDKIDLKIAIDLNQDGRVDSEVNRSRDRNSDIQKGLETNEEDISLSEEIAEVPDHSSKRGYAFAPALLNSLKSVLEINNEIIFRRLYPVEIPVDTTVITTQENDDTWHLRFGFGPTFTYAIIRPSPDDDLLIVDQENKRKLYFDRVGYSVLVGISKKWGGYSVFGDLLYQQLKITPKFIYLQKDNMAADYASLQPTYEFQMYGAHIGVQKWLISNFSVSGYAGAVILLPEKDVKFKSGVEVGINVKLSDHLEIGSSMGIEGYLNRLGREEYVELQPFNFFGKVSIVVPFKL
ncbi:hypothetical protein C900_05922 [Fulvivirga imtechensis AK7]|uniref:Uncharacterized protein n=1 Tax=Fulvivirga imtechensis AK7 TaxID=1237149 RepID=L8JMP2_9BACT|nr:hypothetical protein [Fulvivirga imtechensis]ELR68739.1 hypothetical protein C900_05922 [Fulvivirga imtechensis AK7]